MTILTNFRARLLEAGVENRKSVPKDLFKCLSTVRKRRARAWARPASRSAQGLKIMIFGKIQENFINFQWEPYVGDPSGNLGFQMDFAYKLDFLLLRHPLELLSPTKRAKHIV